MNLSNLSQSVIKEIGVTQGNLFFKRLSPLQIMILTVTREMEWQIAKSIRGKKRTTKTPVLFASDVREVIEKLYIESCNNPYTRQGFWVAISQLKKDGYVYIAPHKAGTTKRTICLTAAGELLFTYPQSIQLYTTQKP